MVFCNYYVVFDKLFLYIFIYKLLIWREEFLKFYYLVIEVFKEEMSLTFKDLP